MSSTDGRDNSLTSERMLLLLRVEMAGISENLSSSPFSPFSRLPFSAALPESAGAHEGRQEPLLESKWPAVAWTIDTASCKRRGQKLVSLCVRHAPAWLYLPSSSSSRISLAGRLCIASTWVQSFSDLHGSELQQ